jgi:class 3 adenylate cyclase/tetratricopeptide (TPR) repeat protein
MGTCLEPHSREQRKVITALCADLAGSTSLGARLDPEDAREVIGGALARVIRVIEELGGTIKDLAGDGVLALFGAPVSHEDDKERAVRAGLRIIAEVTCYAEEVTRDWDIEALAIRVGIESGLVVVGPVGAGERIEYGAVGDAVNTASRLQSETGPNTLIVGEATYSTIEPLFEWGEPRRLRLKGKPAALSARQAIRPLEVRGKVRGLAGVEVPLVGRTVELSSIQEAVQSAVSGAGNALFIVGDPGVGKSRLLSECRELFQSAAPREGGPLWLEGHCTSYGGSLPYVPFKDLFRAWAGISSEDSELKAQQSLRSKVEALFERGSGHVYASLASLLEVGLEAEDAALVESLAPEALQRRTFDAIKSVFERLATVGPVAVALEDLHWADATSLLVIEHVLSVTEAASLLLVITSRLEQDHPSSRLRQSARERLGGQVREVFLDTLSKGEDAELLVALVGRQALPDDVAKAVLAAAEGNPFFLEELMRSLWDTGALVREEGGWRFDHRVPLEVPESVEKVILSRIDRLSSHCHDALTTASVLGRRFSLPLLQASSRGNGAIPGALRELQRLDLVREVASGDSPEYEFKHALVQEAAHRSLLRRHRRELHLRAAQAVESMYPDRLEEFAGRLAHHYEEAEVADKAVMYLTAAGDRARAVFANEEAITSYEAAIHHVGRLLDSDTNRAAQWRNEMAHLHERLGDVLGLIGKHDASSGAYQSAESFVTESDEFWRSRLRRKRGDTYTIRRQYDEALETLASAEEALGPRPAEPSREWWQLWIEIQLARVHTFYYGNRLDEIAAAVGKTRPILDAYGTAMQRARLSQSLLRMSMRRDRFVIREDSLQHARDHVQAGKELGDPAEVAAARFDLGFALLWHGDLDEAEQEMTAARNYCDESGDMVLLSRCLTYLTVAARRRKSVGKVKSLIELSLPVATAAKMPEYTAMAKANMAWVAWREGNLTEAAAAGRAALELWERLPARYPFDWVALWPMIAAALEQDDIGEAISLLRGLESPTQQPVPASLRPPIERALGAWERDDQDTAHACLKIAMQRASELGYL